MWVMLAVVGVLIAVLTRGRKLKLRRQLVRTPLAGYDTGVRSPWRTPGRRGRPHRGF